MDEAAFKQAVLFMFTDVRREITLAKLRRPMPASARIFRSS
jgi:hypothetical protein